MLTRLNELAFSYLDEIKKPMDLGTMQTKLVQGKYSSMESFAADYRLIIHNCRIFNPPMTYPTDCADVLDKTFEREWAKVSEKKLSYGEKRSLQSVMNKVVADPMYVFVTCMPRVFTNIIMFSSWVFHEPVDPVILGIPTYHDIIPKKDARDLRTIRTKLDNDKYTSVEAFEADIDLMINNAILFNTVESEVGQIATAVRAKVREAMASVNLGSKKRKDTGGTPLPGAKKIKLL
jgi:transcription initiation factor TFIID subunit 2